MLTSIQVILSYIFLFSTKMKCAAKLLFCREFLQSNNTFQKNIQFRLMNQFHFIIIYFKYLISKFIIIFSMARIDQHTIMILIQIAADEA